MLEVRNVTKTYGPVRALSDVSFTAKGGEVIAIVGDNGAGKSTLLKVLSGAHPPDIGALFLAGQKLELRNPHDASRAGIEAVYQDLSLVETLDVASNIHLGREVPRPGILGRLGFIDKRAMRQEGRRLLMETLGVDFGSVARPVEMLSGGQRQAVAIARASGRAATHGSGVVLLDEPTAALGVAQTKRVGQLIRSLSASGHLVIMVSHDLPACFEIAERLLVMRHGRLIKDIAPKDTNLPTIVGLITGAIAP
jgi:ABC-type sugar transport system ATPase subunit